MSLIDCSECGKAFSDRAPACPHCGCPVEFAKQQQVKSIDQMKQKQAVSTPKVLREYLENVRALETDVYTMTMAINNLTAQIKPKPIQQELVVPVKPKAFVEENAAKAGWEAFKGMGIGWGPFALWHGIETNIDTRKRNECNRSKHEAAMAAYQKEMAEYKSASEAELSRFMKACWETDVFNNGIQQQIEMLTAEKKATEAALQKLYDINVIYPKYRGIIPVTMFCEYMDSGRRTDLIGVNGMYELYETELMGQQIVNSLTQINRTLSYISYQVGGITSQLTGIQRNQAMLHEEIARGNEIASQINQSTSKMLEQSALMVASMEDMQREISSMRATTETTAFTTAVAARRIDAIAKIEEHEYALRHPTFPSV